jgi:peptidyl-Lys metalloendopeptidase
MRSGAVTAVCQTAEFVECLDGRFAYVFSGDPYRVHLCPPYFNLPPLDVLQPGARRSDNGTREGTIIHEISHFDVVTGTEDHCYSRTECAEMAASNPELAIENADSYQYFTEDVIYYAGQPIANKPPPAQP